MRALAQSDPYDDASTEHAVVARPDAVRQEIEAPRPSSGEGRPGPEPVILLHNHDQIAGSGLMRLHPPSQIRDDPLTSHQISVPPIEPAGRRRVGRLQHVSTHAATTPGQAARPDRTDRHIPVPPERREEQRLEGTGGCVRSAPTFCRDKPFALAANGLMPARQLAANFSSLIAAKSETSPPIRLVA